MGWSYACDKSFDKKKLIAKITSGSYLSPGYQMLEHRVVGNNLWYLYQTPEGNKTIGLVLMASGYPEMGWGEKGLSESWGPAEVNCPLSLLEMADEPPCDYARDWRNEVRKYHDSIKHEKSVWTSIQVGARLQVGADQYLVESTKYLPKHLIVTRQGDGARFRVSKRNFKSSYLLNAPPIPKESPRPVTADLFD